MKFLGLRLCDHDSNITYTDGTKVKYYNSERDYQHKHHAFQDLNQWYQIIKRWNINPSEIDAIAITFWKSHYDQIQFDESELFCPVDIPLFNLLGFDCPVFRVDHHYCHYLSGWMFDQPDVGIVFDGQGDDYAFHTIFRGDKVDLRYTVKEVESFGQSLTDAGRLLGLRGDSLDFAGKIMAMKAFGSAPKNDAGCTVKELGKFWKTIGSRGFTDLTSSNFKTVCHYVSIAHTAAEQAFKNHFLEYTNEDDVIFYSGGIAQNTVINSEIRKVRPNLYIPPHCNDSGLSLGLVEFLRRYYGQEKFDPSGFPFWQEDESPEEPPSKQTIKNTAELLAQGKIVGWYQGHGEVGPRALGNRSILMDPSIADGKSIINSKVKKREFFRPFGASVLEEKSKDYFDFPHESPYMLYVMDLIDKQSFPSITHQDGTCRAQTVSKDHEYYYDLIEEFEKLTGIPMLLNTSLNVGGKPICGYKSNALEILSNTDMDALVIGDQMLYD